MDNMTTTERNYFIKGICEGFLNVRMENMVNKEQNIRQAYMNGFACGKTKRAAIAESEKENWKKNREDYINATGYKYGYENCDVTDQNLNEEDREIFNKGIEAGRRKKQLEQDLTSFKRVRK